MRKPRKSLIGEKFGQLTVISPDTTQKRMSWLCKCQCGNERIVETSHLKSGHTQSCGCYQKKRAGDSNSTHRQSRTQLYIIWQGIKARCNNPKNDRYNIYGGRGIKLCDEWDASYTAFKEWCNSQGWQKGLTVDRIDNTRGYEPGNCRLISMKEQTRNKRNNVVVDNMVLADFIESIALDTGLKPAGVYYRYYKLKKSGVTPTRENIVNFITAQANQLPLHSESGERFND